MAVMYPRTLLEDDLKSRAEGKVFDALEERLGDGWEVFHSVGWVVRDKEQGSDDGEIDFVIAHPERGVLCLEVKGGGIECKHGEWFGIHDGVREGIRDPFAQAIDHTYAMRRKLGGMPAKGGGELLIGHAVAFPDISVHGLVLAPDAPPELIVDRNDMATIDEAVERALAYHRPDGAKQVGPGANGMKKLREILAPEIRIEVPMAERFLDEEEKLITLTHDQALLLQRHGREKRMVVTGPAGSGKTMLAVERAKRVAAKGSDVLFVCFNRRLRDHLRKAEKDSGIYFNTFHGLCVALAKRAEVPLSVDSGGALRPGLLQRGAAAGAAQRDREARAAVRRAVRRRGAGPQQRLARRADRDAPRSRRGADLAVHGRQPARLREPPRRSRRSSGSST